MYCFVFLQCSKNEWKIVQDVDFFFFPLCSLLIFTPAGFLVLMCEYTVHCHLCDTKPTIGFSFSKKCRKPSDKWIYQKLPLICVQKHRTHLPVITSVKLVLHLEFYLSLKISRKFLSFKLLFVNPSDEFACIRFNLYHFCYVQDFCAIYFS